MRWQILLQLCNRLSGSYEMTFRRGIYSDRKGIQSHDTLCHVMLPHKRILILIFPTKFKACYHLAKCNIEGYSKKNHANATNCKILLPNFSQGRFFFTCGGKREDQCKFFQWSDDRKSGSRANQMSRMDLSDVDSITTYLKAQVCLDFYTHLCTRGM